MKLYPIQIHHGLNPAHLQRAAQLYFDAFRRQASPILGINGQAVAFIRHCINPQQALAAVFEDKLAGFVGLQYGDQSFLRLRLSQFVDKFGWLLGRIRFHQAALFEQSVQAGDLRIESIAVDPAMRGQGVGTWLLNAAKNISSMFQDVRRGAPTEIDAICGAVTQRAELHGINTPYNRACWQLVRAL